VTVIEAESVGTADLSLDVTVNSVPFEGSNVTIIYTLSNNGPDTANDILVAADTGGAGLTKLSSNPSSGLVIPGGGWLVNQLPAGTSVALEVIANIDLGTAGATIVGGREITVATENDPDSIPANRVMTEDDIAVYSIEVLAAPPTPIPMTDLSVSVTADRTTFEVFSIVELEFVVTNQSIIDAENTTFVYTHPNLYGVQQATGCVQIFNQVQCALGQIAGGETRTIPITILAPGVVRSTDHVGSVTSTTTDSNLLNNTTSITLTAVALPPTCPATGEPDVDGPDGNYCRIASGDEIVIDLGTQPIVSDVGPDFVYYEVMSIPGSVFLDAVQIDIGDNPAGPWTKVFEWGDGSPDTNTNVVSATENIADSNIQMSSLYGDGLLRTGITIDIDPILTGSFRYVRVYSSGPLGHAFDAIEVLTPQADIELLEFSLSNPTPREGDRVDITIRVRNNGPDVADVTVSNGWTASSSGFSGGGLQFVQNLTLTDGVLGTGANAGEWTITSFQPGVTHTWSFETTVLPGSAGGTLTQFREILSSSLLDPDSTPNNRVPSEDDQAGYTLNVQN
ncbi:MAG: hypothetical protein AAF125_14270, partial [Chloroflexota bacterium]